MPEKVTNRSHSAASGILTGIAFTDEEAIIGHLDLFSHRVHNLVEIVETVKEFAQLVVSATSLPIIDQESISCESIDGSEMAKNNDYENIAADDEGEGMYL